jgi:antirestriction protein ArdC
MAVGQRSGKLIHKGVSEMTTAVRKRRTFKKESGDGDHFDVYEMVTKKVLEALEKGTVPWRKPWAATLGLPFSMSTKKHYRGVNIWLLLLAAEDNGYQSRWWGTYKKVEELGGHVRKGEHGTVVTFWRSYKKWVEDEENPGEKKLERRFVLRYYRVFNAEQADWDEGSKRPVDEADTRTPVERDEAADEMLRHYLDGGPSLRHAGDRAYYVPATDSITLPPVDAFDSTAEFYSTAFHEVGHSTGHPTRLDRKGIAQFDHFGSEKYSKEELVAEMTAAMLLGVAGLDTPATVENSGAYLRHWSEKLREDPKLLIHAAAQAQHAADYVLGVKYGEEEPTNGDSHDEPQAA